MSPIITSLASITKQFGIGAVSGSVPFSATGGTVTTAAGKTIHTFTASGTFTVTTVTGSDPITGLVEYLIVGGGGGAGNDVGGGGGGGALIYKTSQPVSPGPYSITVGGGGGSGQSVNVKGTPGVETTAFDKTAAGGGGGGSYSSAGPGLPGGSGGGGGDDAASGGPASGAPGGTANSTSPDAGWGNPGGTSHPNTWGGGGGGGAGGAGSNGIEDTQVAGGLGLSYSISGSSVTYAGGGYGNNDYGSVYATGNDTSNSPIGFYGFGANGTGSPNNSPFSGNAGIVIIAYPS